MRIAGNIQPLGFGFGKILTLVQLRYKREFRYASETLRKAFAYPDLGRAYSSAKALTPFSTSTARSMEWSPARLGTIVRDNTRVCKEHRDLQRAHGLAEDEPRELRIWTIRSGTTHE